ncbi:hypothetical protein Taro_009988, partial [Colocasia esculenta]|nr:hypothetical protein [Colocasia esculenta]
LRCSFLDRAQSCSTSPASVDRSSARTRQAPFSALTHQALPPPASSASPSTRSRAPPPLASSAPPSTRSRDPHPRPQLLRAGVSELRINPLPSSIIHIWGAPHSSRPPPPGRTDPDSPVLRRRSAPHEAKYFLFSSMACQICFAGLHVLLVMFTGYLVGFATFRALFNHSSIMVILNTWLYIKRPISTKLSVANVLRFRQ